VPEKATKVLVEEGVERRPGRRLHRVDEPDRVGPQIELGAELVIHRMASAATMATLPGGDVPNTVLKAWRNDGTMSDSQYNKMRKDS
jgi:hypothetical protein